MGGLCARRGAILPGSNASAGEELSVLDGSNNWQLTNVYAAGKLMGTYDTKGLHYHLEDPLGTRRMQLSGNQFTVGQPEIDIQSLPYGDAFFISPDPYADVAVDDATPLHFTGKEHDSESGNDYFGARYFASSMARFLTPDWSAKVEPVPYSKLDDPQSLNLYAYVRNNPLMYADLDGHDGSCPKGSYCDALKNAWNQIHQIANKVGAAAKQVADNPRVRLAAKAGLNTGIAAVKTGEAAAGALAAPVTFGATAAVTVYEGIGAAGNIAAAGLQTVGAITGDVKDYDKAADVVSSVTTISGVTTLVATHGDLEKASRNAAIENLITTGITAKGLTEGPPLSVGIKTLDAGQSVKEGQEALSPEKPDQQ